VGIEARAAQRRRQARLVEAVDHQHVDAAGAGLRDPDGGVGMHHPKAIVVGRHAELRSQRDDVGAQFDDADARAWEVAVAELGQRAAAQADQHDVARARHEQRKAHHRARIGQHQPAGARQPHLALHVARREFERAHVAVRAHQGRRWRRAKRLGG
jgi:hypothetical protein